MTPATRAFRTGRFSLADERTFLAWRRTVVARTVVALLAMGGLLR